jgi:UDP-N-acetylmuramate dehydrogenase
MQENIPLKPFNTFGIDVSAKYFDAFHSVEALKEDLLFIKDKNIPWLILGGGSNILFTKNYDGAVLKNELLGIEIVNENENKVTVKSFAGEKWHSLVLFCVEKNLGGLENLSLIPGNVGASPIQNIGAYGAEMKDCFVELEALNIATLELEIFSKLDCHFGYRESVFKNKFRNQYIICSATFQLNKNPHYNTMYGSIEKELEKTGVKELSVKAISDAVIHIRSSKLPDPSTIGNAGSFFKNPIINKELFEMIHSQFHDAVVYPQGKDFKLGAAWLIEKCGWKGFRRGDAGVHEHHALVLINYGSATGKEIFDLSEEILQSVKQKFGVELEREVNIF